MRRANKSALGAKLVWASLSVGLSVCVAGTARAATLSLSFLFNSHRVPSGLPGPVAAARAAMPGRWIPDRLCTSPGGPRCAPQSFRRGLDRRQSARGNGPLTRAGV